MNNLKVIKEADSDGTLCYVTDEKTAAEKLEGALENFTLATAELTDEVLSEYAYFVQYGSKETPSFTFTRGNDTDWFIAQVAIKQV